MKIGLAQINTTVGDLAGNRQAMLAAYHALVAEGAELVVFPELVISGYPPRDLLFRKRFLADCAASLEAFAAEVGPVPAVVGYPEDRAGRPGRQAANAAAWCEDGKVRGSYAKCLLPSYDVFDEDRYFEPGPRPGVHRFGDLRVGITICEDFWFPIEELRYHRQVDPVHDLASQEPDLVINLSASPWHLGKQAVREDLVRRAAGLCHCPVVYCNSIGGNDELVFDGDSLVVAADGRVCARLAAFAPENRVVDLREGPAGPVPAAPEGSAAIEAALTLGLRDYAHKSGFRQAVIGLSGGIDSAVTAVIAVRALGAGNVLGISLPSRISSAHSRTDARDLAQNLGIRFETLPIGDLVSAAEGTLEGLFAGTEADVTEENIQSRARGLLLMAVSNKFGHLLLTTGNKSEVAVGYCTLYGDMAGGLAVLSDVPKTEVFRLAEHLNSGGEVIPRSTIEKPPSAELRPDQKDEDSLPPYPVLDEILRLYVEEGHSARDIVQVGFEEAVVRDVARKVDRNEYKRKQAAPGIKLTPRAFGVGRRIPIVQKYVS